MICWKLKRKEVGCQVNSTHTVFTITVAVDPPWFSIATSNAVDVALMSTITGPNMSESIEGETATPVGQFGDVKTVVLRAVIEVELDADVMYLFKLCNSLVA